MNYMTPSTDTESSAEHASVHHSQGNGRRTLATVLITLFVGVPALMFWGGAFFFFLILGAFLRPSEEAPACNVAEIPLHGIVTSTSDGFTRLLGLGMLSSADDFIRDVSMANEDPTIEAIVIDIDSPGGTPVAADEMMRALVHAEKPVVALIRGVGASAAYWIAAGADHIVASPVSQVGSIGVTMSYLEIASSTDMSGSRWIDLSSGFYKDAGNPERALREEERDHFRTQIAGVHEYMISRIAEARSVLSHEEVAQLADGRTYLGTEALSRKLVDSLGGAREVDQWIADTLRISPSDVVRCGPYTGSLLDLFL